LINAVAWEAFSMPSRSVLVRARRAARSRCHSVELHQRAVADSKAAASRARADVPTILFFRWTSCRSGVCRPATYGATEGTTNSASWRHLLKTHLHEMLRRLQFVRRQYVRIHGSGQWTSVQ